MGFLDESIRLNHQEVSKGSSLKRSCCMPVCCDQGNEFGLNTKAMFVPWVSCCCMGDFCLFVDGEWPDIIHY